METLHLSETSLDAILLDEACLDDLLGEGPLDAACLVAVLDVAIKLHGSWPTGAWPLDGCFAGLALKLSVAFVQGAGASY